MKLLSVISVGVMAMASQLHAAVTLPAIGGPLGGSQGDPQTTGYVNDLFPDDCVLELIAKWTPNDQGGATWSSLASGVSGSNFSVTHVTSTTPDSADISWDLTGTGFGLYAVMGSQSGTMQFHSIPANSHIIGSGSIPAPGNGRGWSHISFFGKKSDTPDDPPSRKVPDGGTTLVCFGLALLGLGSMRKLVVTKA